MAHVLSVACYQLTVAALVTTQPRGVGQWSLPSVCRGAFLQRLTHLSDSHSVTGEKTYCHWSSRLCTRSLRRSVRVLLTVSATGHVVAAPVMHIIERMSIAFLSVRASGDYASRKRGLLMLLLCAARRGHPVA
jgi:hypothetical protein